MKSHTHASTLPMYSSYCLFTLLCRREQLLQYRTVRINYLAIFYVYFIKILLELPVVLSHVHSPVLELLCPGKCITRQSTQHSFSQNFLIVFLQNHVNISIQIQKNLYHIMVHKP